MLFERIASIIKSAKGNLVETSQVMRDGHEPAAEIDRIRLGDVTVLTPIRIENFVGDVGVDERAQRRQAPDWDALLHGHSGGGNDFPLAGRNGCRLAAPN